MRIYGDLNSGNCLKVKYTAEFLGLAYELRLNVTVEMEFRFYKQD